MSNHTAGTNRSVYIDFLRIFAILLVLFNHTQYNGFTLFTVRTESVFFPFYLFCAIFCKIAVPLYFMISGALLLRKEESYIDILKKRFFKYVLILFTASLVVYLLRNYDTGLSVRTFLTTVYSSNMYSALWFIYAYLSYILMLPLLRRMANAMKETDFFWLFGIALLFSLIKILQFCAFRGSISYNGSFNVPFLESTIFYPLIGYYAGNKLDIQKVNKKIILLCIILSILAICTCGWLTCEWCTLKGEWKESSCQAFFNTLIYIPTITVFIATKKLFTQRPVDRKLEKIITSVGSTTFGVFLFETLYRPATKIIFTTLANHIPSFLACIIWVICAFLLGSGITFILKKIPIIRSYL